MRTHARCVLRARENRICSRVFLCAHRYARAPLDCFEQQHAGHHRRDKHPRLQPISKAALPVMRRRSMSRLAGRRTITKPIAPTNATSRVCHLCWCSQHHNACRLRSCACDTCRWCVSLRVSLFIYSRRRAMLPACRHARQSSSAISSRRRRLAMRCSERSDAL